MRVPALNFEIGSSNSFSSQLPPLEVIQSEDESSSFYIKNYMSLIFKDFFKLSKRELRIILLFFTIKSITYIILISSTRIFWIRRTSSRKLR